MHEVLASRKAALQISVGTATVTNKGKAIFSLAWLCSKLPHLRWHQPGVGVLSRVESASLQGLT